MLPENAPLAMTQKLWFQHDEHLPRYGDDIWRWLKATHPTVTTKRPYLIIWYLAPFDADVYLENYIKF